MSLVNTSQTPNRKLVCPAQQVHTVNGTPLETLPLPQLLAQKDITALKEPVFTASLPAQKDIMVTPPATKILTGANHVKTLSSATLQD